MSEAKTEDRIACPVCSRFFQPQAIEDHVNKCLFLNAQDQTPTSKRARTDEITATISPQEKRLKLGARTKQATTNNQNLMSPPDSNVCAPSSAKSNDTKSNVPLAERMRPKYLEDIVGQSTAFGPGSMLRSLLERKQIPNMILWGPPGCGKTSLANVISTMCKEEDSLRFVKLSATMAGINDVKEVVKVAKNEHRFKRQTVLFMDEIHRFNKLQQDTFLPHVETGTIVLIGATTENPSFSLNNALLSRCRVIVMEKLSVENVFLILVRALEKNKYVAVIDAGGATKDDDVHKRDPLPRCIVEKASLRWLAEICDGDARVALSALELALASRDPGEDGSLASEGPSLLTLDDIKEGIKRTHTLYDRKGEEHYNIVSALHKSIRAGDDNAALYWTARALQGGEDPLYVARRLVRASAEDIGLAEPSCLAEAVSCLQGCQHLGMPECDVLLAQLAVRLARAPKSTEVYRALRRCQRSLAETKGPLPGVPLHLRNAPTKLMKQLGYGHGYNMRNRNESGLNYMPEGMEGVDFFVPQPDDGDG